MINELIKALLTSSKETKILFQRINKENVLNVLFKNEFISNTKILAKNNSSNFDYSFDFKGKTFYFLNTSNELMCPIKQNRYFKTDSNTLISHGNEIPFIFIFEELLYMIVINQEIEIIEFYRTENKLPLPFEHYIIRNGTTFVDYNNYNNIEFRLISETPNYEKIEDRNFKVEQVQAIDMLMQLKVANF